MGPRDEPVKPAAPRGDERPGVSAVHGGAMRTQRPGTWACVLLGLLAGGCQPHEREALHKVGARTAAQFDGVTGPPRERLAAGWLGVRGSLGDATPDSRV